MSNAILHITLSQLQSRISDAIIEALPLPLWICAEVADIKINRTGHCYIELVEKDEKSGAILAKARATIWRNGVPTIIGGFERESGRKLGAGMKILLRATVSYHALYEMSLQIMEIDASYTLGDMQRQKQLTIQQLHEEGVWDMNHSLSLPRVVQRVAVISSATAAGYRDFTMELGRSIYNIHTELFEATMQGATSEESVTAALYAIAKREEEFDAVAIIRGGGSTIDLECFNSYLMAATVAQFPLPILTGIGHDKDTSVTDMVAHLQLKTPTAVATWLVSKMEEFDGELELHSLSLRDICNNTTHRATIHLESLANDIRNAVERTFATEQQRIEGINRLIENFAPERIFRLGYAIARKEGKALCSIDAVDIGDTIEVALTGGTIESKIVKITKDNGKEE